MQMCNACDIFVTCHHHRFSDRTQEFVPGTEKFSEIKDSERLLAVGRSVMNRLLLVFTSLL